MKHFPDEVPNGSQREPWKFRLYVAGRSPKSLTALHNLKLLCDQHLPGAYEIELVDLVEKPGRAQQDQILAVPTLVRYWPQPIKRIIGDLSDHPLTLSHLGIAVPVSEENAERRP